MAEEKTITYVWEGDATDLNRTVTGINQRFDRLEDKTQRTGREMAQTSRQVKRTDRSMVDLSKSIRMTTSGFTVLGRAGGQGSRVLGNLAGGLTRAAGTAGAAGIAMVGLGAGIALTIGAIGVVAAGLARLTVNARELRIEAEDFPGFINQRDIDRLIETDDALEAAALAVKGMGVAIAVDLAPAIEKGVVFVTALSMAVRDTPQAILKTVDAVMLLSNAFYRLMIDRLNPMERLKDPLGAHAVASFQRSVADFKDSLSTAEITVDNYIPRAQALIGSYAETAQAAEDAAASSRAATDARRAESQAARELAAAAAALAAAQGQVNASITTSRSDLIGQEEELTRRYQDQIAALDELAGTHRDLEGVETARTQAAMRLERDLAALRAATRAEEERAETARAAAVAGVDVSPYITGSANMAEATRALTEDLEKQGATQAEIAAKVKALHTEVQTAVLNSTATTLGAIASIADSAASRGGRAARRLAIVSKAAGIAQATVSTYVGATKALELGPILGPPAMVAQIATGLAQVAQIVAVPLPSAHIGTPAGGTLAPDERVSFGRRVLQTEMSTPGAVANSTATRLIDDANNGKLSGGGQVVRAVIGRTHIDEELYRSGRSGTTRYARNLRTNPHPSQNRGY